MPYLKVTGFILSGLVLMVAVGCKLPTAGHPKVVASAPTGQTKVSTDQPHLDLPAIMQEAAEPAPEHKIFEEMVGRWEAVAKWRTAPNGTFMSSAAEVTKNLVLNGMFLQEQYVDTSESQPFNGIGMLGYDKVLGKYTSYWFDTMSSTTWSSTGELLEDGKTIRMNGGGMCPVKRARKDVVSELTLVSRNTQVYRMYDTGSDGKPFLSLEITYSRR